MVSELSETADSPDSAKMRMPCNIYGPISDMRDGTTINAQAANTCVPAGYNNNKTPIFISGFRDPRANLL
jgi:hypothetical protein